MRLFSRCSFTWIFAGVAASLPVHSGLVLLAPGAAAAEPVFEEMVITARKREETLSTVPASITALSATALERGGVESLADVAMQTPGLTFYSGNAGGLSAPTIRGIAATTTTTFDNNVGVFLDGVFLSSKANLDVSMFNLERVEIIRGPQSALYGNNTFSGAINYVTKQPSQELEGRVSGTIGTGNRYDISGTVSGPLISDKLAARLSASYSHFGGTIKNVLSDDKLGGWDYKRAFAADVLFTPTEAFSARLFYYNSREELDGSANYMFPNNCGGLNAPNIPGRAGTNFRYFCGSMEAPDEVSVDPAAFSKLESQLAYANLSYDFEWAELKSITSYGDNKNTAIADQKLDRTTPTAARNFTTPYFGPLTEWSQELRLESYGNRMIDWAFGGYYYDRDASYSAKSGLGPNLTNATTDITNHEKSKMKAVFGLLQYNVTDAIRLNGELRYTEDKKNAAFVNNLTNTTLELQSKYDYWTYRATADYRLSESSVVYATVGSGTKSGGFNNSSIESEKLFSPEKNTTYEIGVKDGFFDRRLNVSLSAFYIDWNDIQMAIPSALAFTRNYVTNFGSASAKGIELEFNSEPIDNWQLSGGFSFTDSKWDQGTLDYSSTRACATPAACGFVGMGIGGLGIDVGGKTIPKASKYQVNLSSTYTWTMDNFDLYVRGDYSYRSEQISLYAIGLQTIPGISLVNARIGANFDAFEVSIWAQNLLNERYITGAVTEPEFFPSSTYSTGFLANTRTLGVSASYKF